MLIVNLRHLEPHEIRLQGELAVEELNFNLNDDMIRAERSLQYNLQVERIHHAILAQGRLQITLDCQCVRCLKPFEKKLVLENWTLHLPLEGEEKVVVDNDCVDLTPFVREDILLEFPQHPLCKPDCGGFKKISLKNREEDKSAWAELNKLKL